MEEKKEESKVDMIEDTSCPTLNSVEEKTRWEYADEDFNNAPAEGNIIIRGYPAFELLNLGQIFK